MCGTSAIPSVFRWLISNLKYLTTVKKKVTIYVVKQRIASYFSSFLFDEYKNNVLSNCWYFNRGQIKIERRESSSLTFTKEQRVGVA